MPTPGRATPRQRIEEAGARRGERAVAAGCAEFLRGDWGAADLLLALGGPPARALIGGAGTRAGYWPRVWGARGLLYCWTEEASATVVAATRDDAWRVREMVLKVIARRRLDEALPSVVALRADPVPRVRAAAERALARLTSGS